MQKIRFINPSDPVIVSIARNFNAEHYRISLLTELELAWRGNIVARNLIENEPLLLYGVNQIPKRLYNDQNSSLGYLYAVALAQRRLKREGNEYAQLERLIKMNFSRESKKYALSTIWKIADKLYENDESCGTNFLNYVIDKFIFISTQKKQAFTDGRSINVTSIDTGDVEVEVMSDEHGFNIDDYDTADTISDLFDEAAATPWDINRKIIKKSC